MNLPSYERTRAMGLLHRFFRESLVIGRMPSLLGREVFRSRTGNRPARAFEDTVVFLCDVERCLRQLTEVEQRLIAFCVLEDHTEWEAARMFHRSQSDVSRRLKRALDFLHEVFCRQGLLKPIQEPGDADGRG